VWADMPREVVTLFVVFLLCGAAVALFYKELKITSFDPDLATTLGISSRIFHYGLMTMVAIACVAAFEAVGSILVIAMLIIPAAIARLLTDKLSVQIWLSLVAALAIGPGGYVLAAFGPFWVGGSDSLSASGMMAVLAGALLVLAIVLAPHYGMIAGRRNRRKLRAAMAAR
jgi:manganese/zinc/iron transport system permease protein